MENKKEYAAKLISEGCKLLGTGANAAIVYQMTKDPILTSGMVTVTSAILGSQFEKAFDMIGEETKKRMLAPLEEQKIYKTSTFAAIKIKKLFDENKPLRTDDFFEEFDGRRSAAEEIFEHTVLVAQKEYDDMKLVFIGYLYAGIAFDESISRDEANKLVDLASRLSYRQIKLIGLFIQNKFQIGNLLNPLEMFNQPEFDSFFNEIGIEKENFPIPVAQLPNKNYLNGIRGYSQISLLQDIFDLINMGIFYSPEGTVRSVNEINPSKIEPVGLGAQLYNLMDLRLISPRDKQELVDLL
ncbi:hypothetical protein [Enterococcus sp. AZ102]|uniref:hypothetical protein n=1 Tax=Enterococcus sp. AZ102 TaxID=2774865 RepID=UPI003F21129A